MWQAEAMPDLGGLHRHGRAFPKAQNTMRLPVARRTRSACRLLRRFRGFRVGCMQRARDDAVLLPFAALAQIDEGHVRAADERGCSASPAQ
jgi:hypothetical protein